LDGSLAQRFVSQAPAVQLRPDLRAVPCTFIDLSPETSGPHGSAPGSEALVGGFRQTPRVLSAAVREGSTGAA
jgi:hypothetical protein